MKLSPLDIQHKVFDYRFRGYNPQQVEAFLSKVAQQLEEHKRENKRLSDDLNNKGTLIEELQTGERELKRAIVSAERIGNEMKGNAKHEAQLIIREAEQRKEAMLREAKAQLKSIRADLSRLERERDLFREQFRGMLRAFERTLEVSPAAKREVSPPTTKKVTSTANKVLPRDERADELLQTDA